LQVSAFAGDNTKEPKQNVKTFLIKITDEQGQELAGASVVLENGKQYFSDFNGMVQVQVNARENQSIHIITLGFQEKTLETNSLSTFAEVSLNSLP